MTPEHGEEHPTIVPLISGQMRSIEIIAINSLTPQQRPLFLQAEIILRSTIEDNDRSELDSFLKGEGCFLADYIPRSTVSYLAIVRLRLDVEKNRQRQREKEQFRQWERIQREQRKNREPI